MSKSSKFSQEIRKCAVRLVGEKRAEYLSMWAAIESIARKIGCVLQPRNCFGTPTSLLTKYADQMSTAVMSSGSPKATRQVEPSPR